MVDEMPSVPAPAVPAELRGVKGMTKLKGLVVENSLTRLCPVLDVTSYPGPKVRHSLRQATSTWFLQQPTQTDSSPHKEQGGFLKQIRLE